MDTGTPSSPAPDSPDSPDSPDAHAPESTGSDWRTVRYQPFPGAFWPTNGSTGDVFIRLPKPPCEEYVAGEGIDVGTGQHDSRSR